MKNDAERIMKDFHDTSLVAMSQRNSDIFMTIEYYDENDIEKSMNVVISGVEAIFMDDTPISDMMMETTHGSIIVLERQAPDIVLLVEWIDFSSGTRTTRFYKMSGPEVRLLQQSP